MAVVSSRQPSNYIFTLLDNLQTSYPGPAKFSSNSSKCLHVDSTEHASSSLTFKDKSLCICEAEEWFNSPAESVSLDGQNQ